MAYNFVRASSQSITSADLANNLGPPFTLVGFCSSTNTTDTQVLIGVSDGLNPTDRHVVILRGAVAGDPIEANSTTDDGNPPTDTTARTTSGYTSGVWFHGAGVYQATNLRNAFINGGSKSPNGTVNVPITGIKKPSIGATPVAGVLTAFLEGDAAEVAIWSAALTDAEITSLSKGFKPYRVRPQSLVFYAPLVRDLIDARGGLALTNNNTATVAAHPRVY